ncbi:MAG: radical SAM protein [Betaproteobacteria bacterium]|nr:radical SAM protein [Betaproteobacteria bacterium]
MNHNLPPATRLNVSDHSRASVGMRYVYPVISRRAGGVSLGINLNPNNACNWRCIYCQVPDLKRGAAPATDLALLEIELREMLHDVLHGEFMAKRVPVDARHFEDIAFSGNGEPTSSPDFLEAVKLVLRLVDEFELRNKIVLRLITNGSLIDKPQVQHGLDLINQAAGEVWFKLDAGSREGITRINGVGLDPAGIVRRMRECGRRCTTWVQTCCFACDGFAPNEEEISSWLGLLDQAKENLAGVHLYGLARPSLQAEAPRLARLPPDWLELLAERVDQIGLKVRISP